MNKIVEKIPLLWNKGGDYKVYPSVKVYSHKMVHGVMIKKTQTELDEEIAILKEKYPYGDYCDEII